MASMFIWMIVLTVSVSSIIISAAYGSASVHMFMAGAVSIAMALVAIQENKSLRQSGASRSTVSASAARYMGLVWLWGGLAVLVTYLFILQWKEWWPFFAIFMVLGVLCLFFAAAIERDEAAGRTDETLLNLSRYLAIGQLIGMAIAVIGLLIDPGKTFLDTKAPDWAANNIFFFGALALLAITGYSLASDKQKPA